jgi:hypothetical protein
VWGGQLTRAALVLAVAAGVAWLASWLSKVDVRFATRSRRKPLLAKLHGSCHRPWAAILFLAILIAALPAANLTSEWGRLARHLVVVALIATVAWLVVRALYVVEDMAFRRLPVDVPANLRVRRVRTQIGLVRRLTAALVGTLAVAIARLRSHPSTRGTIRSSSARKASLNVARCCVT